MRCEKYTVRAQQKKGEGRKMKEERRQMKDES
jgi:hypothetical protein